MQSSVVNLRVLAGLTPTEIRAIINNSSSRKEREYQANYPGLYAPRTRPLSHDELTALLAKVGEAFPPEAALTKIRRFAAEARPDVKVYVYRGASAGMTPGMTEVLRVNGSGVTFLTSSAKPGEVIKVQDCSGVVLFNGFGNLGSCYLHWLVLEPVEGELPKPETFQAKKPRRRITPAFTSKERELLRALEMEFGPGGIFRRMLGLNTILRESAASCARPTLEKALNKLVDAGALDRWEDPLRYRATGDALSVLAKLDYKD